MSGRRRKKYALKSAFDVAELFASLDEDGRAILSKDLCLAGDMLREIPAIVRVFVKLSAFTWIDDDKGVGTFVLDAGAKGPELARWERRAKPRAEDGE